MAASPKPSKPTRTSWWGDLAAEAEEEWGEARESLWSTKARGASALGDWLTPSWGYSRNDDAVWTYTESLRFAAGFARIVAGKALKSCGWIVGSGETVPYARLDTGQIALGPSPIKEQLAGTLTTDEARTIVAGVAIHEAAHLAATPLDWCDDFMKRYGWGDFKPDPWQRDARGDIVYNATGAPIAAPAPPPNPFPEFIGRAARALVEDAFVETVALARYPGYQSYLDECWRHVRPEDMLVTKHLKPLVGNRKSPKAGEHALEIIQDQARRYTEPGPEYQALYGKLHPSLRAYFAACQPVLRRAHNPNLTVDERNALATELGILMAHGTPKPEPEPERPPTPAGPTPPPPPPEGGIGGDPAPRDPSRPRPEPDPDGEERGGTRGPSAADPEGPPKGPPPPGEEPWAPDPKQLAGMDKKAMKELFEEGILDGPGRASRDGLDRHTASEVMDAVERDMQRESVTIQAEDGTRKAPVVWQDIEPNARAFATSYAEVAPLIQPLKRRLAFRSTTAERLVGAQLRGRLDGRRLAEVPIAIARGRQPRAFARREQIAAPMIAVPLLIDMSGSMGLDRSRLARQAAILFREALEALKRETNGDVDYSIHGHSTRGGSSRGEECAIYRIADATHHDPALLGGIKARANNHDGPALAAIARYAEARWPDRQRVIIYINDGQPAGQTYGGIPAMNEIANHRRWLAARGTTILTLFLGNGGKPHNLQRMYGPEGQGFIMVREMHQLPTVIGRALTKLLKWHA